MRRTQRKNRRLPRLRHLILLVFTGVLFGTLCYEFIMLARIARLRHHNPASTALIEARASEALVRGQTPRKRQIWMPLNRISPHLQRAVLAGEDANFFAHGGFDYNAIQKAWEHAQREAAKEGNKSESGVEWIPSLGDFKRGASTISQQLVKNLYLSSDRTLFRKGQEAILTIFLERLLNKHRILELYLNLIEWGDGVYGVEAAARMYFNKSAAALSPSEAAFLAAIIPNPRTVFNPRVNPRRVARRQNIILRGMSYVRFQ